MYRFSGGADGPYPIGLTFHNGLLYGVTTSSDRGVGTVFQLTPPASGDGPWTESTLHAFKGEGDGLYPYGSLVFDNSGAIYGTTAGGGNAACCGIVFQLLPPATQGSSWTENILYKFTGTEKGGSGDNPTGVAFDNGILYGTNCSGRLFQLVPAASGSGAWQHTALANFTPEQAICPQGLVLQSGRFYGTGASGGPFGNDSGNGTVYIVTP